MFIGAEWPFKAYSLLDFKGWFKIIPTKNSLTSAVLWPPLTGKEVEKERTTFHTNNMDVTSGIYFSSLITITMIIYKYIDDIYIYIDSIISFTYMVLYKIYPALLIAVF